MGLPRHKYKYLVVSGCSQTQGQCCNVSKIWSKLLADELNLELINLATAGSGWYTLETTITSFINSNREIVKDCLFILQKSMLERCLDYENLPLFPSDVWEEYNINYLSQNTIRVQGYRHWENYGFKRFEYKLAKHEDEGQTRGMYGMFEDYDVQTRLKKFTYFPEHRHYPNSRHNWKPVVDGVEFSMDFIEEQFNELMLHFGQRMLSFHLFLKSVGADHVMVDGYSPFLSYKLDFKNYYDTDDEFEMVKRFWSSKPDEGDEDEVMLYDFKNISSGWVFDEIDNKYKIDDVVLWSLYQFKEQQSWNYDGGHAGPDGMKLIKEVILENLVKKGWIEH